MTPLVYRKIGHIVKPHGVHGKLKVRLSANATALCWEQPTLWVRRDPEPSLERHEVDSFYETTPGFGLLGLKTIWDMSAAEALRQCTLHMPRKETEPPTASEEGLQELLGYTLNDAQKGCVGTIETLHFLPTNPLFGVVDSADKEHLIPIQPLFIIKIDHAARCIHMDLPDGMVDLV